MPDVTVYSTDPGLASLLANGAQFNVIQQAQRRLQFATGEGVLGLVGGVVNDRGAPNVCVELEGKIDDLRTRYGGFSPYLGDGHATGYEGNLYARCKGLDAPRIVLMPVDLALKDKTITDATAVDLEVSIARGLRTFTVEEADDIFTCTAHGLAANDTVQLVSLTGGTGAVIETTYHVIAPVTTDSFKLSETSGGASLAITLDGSGTLRPISVAAGVSLDAYTIPAGTRIKTSNASFVVRTLEDVAWDVDAFAAQSVRVAKVSGTEAAINTVNAFYSTITDTTDGVSAGSTTGVVTTATTVPDAVDAAELLLRYERAFDSILDTALGQAITVIATDRDESGVGDALSDHCASARARGYFRRGVVAPPVGTSAANARLASGDGVGRATLDTTMVAYVHGGVRRSFLEDSANLTAPDYLVTVPAALALAARIANTPPWENPARPHRTLRTYGIVALEALSPTIAPVAHFRANIVVPEFTRQDGALVASFRDGILADGTKIADARLQDYLSEGLLGVLAPYHKLPATSANREAAEDACIGFLQLLVGEGKVAGFAVSTTWDADNDHLRVQAAVDKTGNLDVITLDLLVGGSAVAESGIGIEE